MKYSRGFSLVELSIVLVILGLLTGGILAGQSLIRAAELRAIPTEHARYASAVLAFRDRYMAIPGDFRDATRFWGRFSNTNCVTNSAAALNASTGTCDGDGNGRLNDPVAAGNTNSENFQFWRQLSLAGLIEGSYTGLTGPHASGYEANLGINAPASRMGNAGWTTNFFTSSTSPIIFNIRYENTFYFGAATTNSLTGGKALKPEELWGIDTKIDDGKPGRGSVIARHADTCTDAGVAAGSENNLDANYLLSSNATACAIYFKSAF